MPPQRSLSRPGPPQPGLTGSSGHAPGWPGYQSVNDGPDGGGYHALKGGIAVRIVGSGTSVVLEMATTLSVHEVPEICRAINHLADQGGTQVVIDLSRVTVIDPLGVLGLLGWRQQMIASGGDLAIYRPQPAVAQALDMFYVSRQLKETDLLPDAL
jgi:anti-anti-sigma factor